MASQRTFNLSMFAIAVVLLLAAAFRVVAIVTHTFWQALGPSDLLHYLEATKRWLATGTPYVATEVAGPFAYGGETFLHPPIALPFFAVFLAAPIQLFWIVPLTGFTWLVLAERPASWTWPLIALLLATYPLGPALYAGNTDMWAWLFFAAGVRWGWPLALLAVKPSVAIVGFIGIRNRRTWCAALLMIVLCVPFGSLWVDWLRVVTNSPGTVLYSAHNALMFAIPLIARIGSRRDPLPMPIWRRPFALLGLPRLVWLAPSPVRRAVLIAEPRPLQGLAAVRRRR
jgi:hypothetical protein